MKNFLGILGALVLFVPVFIIAALIFAAAFLMAGWEYFASRRYPLQLVQRTADVVPFQYRELTPKKRNAIRRQRVRDINPTSFFDIA
jgi:hypothetical protein